MIRVKVPATTANIGSGFDCLGMALNIYNIIEIYDSAQGLTIETNPIHKDIEPGEDNLIYKSIKKAYDEVGKEVPPLRIVQEINIPVSRGLGSSAACIVGGLAAANEMLGNLLSRNKILELATEIEGHPDNVAPALLGGFVVSAKTNDGVRYIQQPIKSTLKLMAMIPDFSLSTKEARGVLPSLIDYKDAVFNVGRSSLLTASLITGNYENIKYAVEDKLHQPYRLNLIPDGENIYKAAYDNGVDAFFISGSGSTLMAIINNESIIYKMKKFFSDSYIKWEIKLVEVDNLGVQVIRE